MAYFISGGTISSGITLTYNESMHIYSGGVANSTTVNGGILWISSGGVANNTTVNRGSMSISSGGVANNTYIVGSGSLVVSSGGVANSTTVANSGYMRISSGGVANNTYIVGSGNLVVSSGGVANSTTVANSGYMHLSSGGVANSITISSGAVVISSGGVANNTEVNSYGSITVFSGGVIESTTVNRCGSIKILSGGTATAIKENRGCVDIEDGANVTFVSNTISGGYIWDSMSLHSNTVANNVTNAGVMYIFSGGVANYIINSGTVYIYSGGVLKGGFLGYFSTISAYEGAIIDFTVAEKTASDGYMIIDFSDIHGDATYTITVDSNQKFGTYKLAQEAQNISSTLSINTESGNIGTLTVNGDVLEYNDRKYKLTNSNGNLHLSIQDIATTADTNLLSNETSQILAWDSEKGKVGYIANDGSVPAVWRGVWEWSGAEADLWRVAGVGHFKGSEVDYDGVLLYNEVGNRFAAWTDLQKGSYGYVDLCKVDGSFNTQCLANLDGDEYDDILIYDTNGSIGVVLGGTTYKDIFHVNEGDFATWTIVGAGSFDDGMDKLVMVNNYNNQVYLWTNQDTSFSTWNWKTQSVGTLSPNWKVVAVADFEGDGIDDIMVQNLRSDEIWIWDDGNSKTKRWRGTLRDSFEIEASGDYNGDGCADLLLREHNSGWGGLGYWANGYAGNWVDLSARIETDLRNSFDVIA